MRIAHVIVAHKNPAQLEKLLKAMHHVDFDFFIHLDGKFDISPFRYLENLPQVFFIENRKICNWGGFSIVETILFSIQHVLDSHTEYEFINLLSAQDYPIVPVNEIYEFFYQRMGYSFFSFDKRSNTLWWKEAEQRYKKYHFTDMHFKGKYFIQKLVNKILPERKLPSAIMQLYGGNKSCWFTISKEAAIYILSYFKMNPGLKQFLKFTWAADEFILPTILMNSPLKHKIIPENYRYMQWKYGEAHPKILNIDDYENIINSGMLFARKFDDEIDDKIITKLNSAIYRPL